jgi:hypothetical protein
MESGIGSVILQSYVVSLKNKQFMKFRCTTNSIRLRVRKSDLEQLRLQGQVEDAVDFGGGSVFRFVLKTGAVPTMRAVFEHGTVEVHIPAQEAVAWIDSERVSMVGTQPLEGNGVLEVLVEKDFPCRHTLETNREDTFYELAPEDSSC